MQRVTMDYALFWDRQSASFERVPLPERFPRWRFEPAPVEAERFEPSALSALAALTRIDPDVPVYLGPHLIDWDVEHQDWGTDRRTIWGLCQTANGSMSLCSRGVRMPVALAVSLRAPDPAYVLAHEMMHIVLKTLPEAEMMGMMCWGDLIRSLDRYDEVFHSAQHCSFLQLPEEAEAEAFGLWASRGVHPYRLNDPNARSVIGNKTGIDLDWVVSFLPVLEDFYAAVLRGDYSARKQVLGQAVPKPRKTFMDRLRVRFHDRGRRD